MPYYLKCLRCGYEFPSKKLPEKLDKLGGNPTVTVEETCPKCNEKSFYQNTTAVWKYPADT